MIRVVLDANIFVSTVLKSRSIPADVFQLAKERKITLISSTLIKPKLIFELIFILVFPLNLLYTLYWTLSSSLHKRRKTDGSVGA